jgi:hypothetical protein
VKSYRGFLNLRDYIKMNQLEGFGYSKGQARFILAQNWAPLLSMESG